jgi:DNA-binding beta-propeller fold protein YncE
MWLAIPLLLICACLGIMGIRILGNSAAPSKPPAVASATSTPDRGQRLYVTLLDSHSGLAVVDPETGAYDLLETAYNSAFVAKNPVLPQAYVVAANGDTLWVINTQTNEIANEITEGVLWNSGPLVVSADGEGVFLATTARGDSGDRSQIAVYDMPEGTLRRIVDFGAKWNAPSIASDGNTIVGIDPAWNIGGPDLANRTGRLFRMDMDTCEIEWLDETTWDTILFYQHGFFYAVDYEASRVSKVHHTGLNPVWTWSADPGVEIRSLVVSNDDTLAVVSTSEGLVTIDGETGTTQAKYPEQSAEWAEGAFGLAIDSSQEIVYTAVGDSIIGLSLVERFGLVRSFELPEGTNPRSLVVIGE